MFYLLGLICCSLFLHEPPDVTTILEINLLCIITPELNTEQSCIYFQMSKALESLLTLMLHKV